jgi:peptidoglycan/xylan/chitin deacetylase (PgdA/CDA1 family)
MVQTASAIEKTLGGPTRLFRSPYGDLRSAYTREALRLKYANILWSNSSADTVTRRADVVYKNVIQYARPGDIVLMHDSATKAHTAKALPRIIATLKKRGYRFLTVPEMLAQWEEWKQKTPVSASKEPARAVARKSNAGR